MRRSTGPTLRADVLSAFDDHAAIRSSEGGSSVSGLLAKPRDVRNWPCVMSIAWRGATVREMKEGLRVRQSDADLKPPQAARLIAGTNQCADCWLGQEGHELSVEALGRDGENTLDEEA
jgi:hypothetical protein